MGQAIDVIKRGGRRPSEPFQPDKLRASIQAACLSVRTPEGEADTIAHSVCQAVVSWCQAKPEITSADLRRRATEALTAYHPDAAYLYKHHRLVI